MTDTIKKQPDLSDRIPAPAKRWRNRYRAKRVYLCIKTGVHFPGHVYGGYRLWPSRDAAESAVCGLRNPAINGNAEYLGAFPE